MFVCSFRCFRRAHAHWSRTFPRVRPSVRLLDLYITQSVCLFVFCFSLCVCVSVCLSVCLSVCVEVKQSYTRVVRQRNARKLHAWFPSTQRTATNARKYATSATDAANGNNKNMQASSVRNERNERKKALCRRRVAYVSARPSACIRTLRTTSSDTTRVKLAYLTCLAKLSSQ